MPRSAAAPAALSVTLYGFERRVHEEARLDQFISDGSLLQEWAHEKALFEQRSPRRAPLRRPIVSARSSADRIFTRGYLTALEGSIFRRAREMYDGIIHLRPGEGVSADQRAVDRALIGVAHRVGSPLVSIAGQSDDALIRVLGFFGLEAAGASKPATPAADPLRDFG